MKEFLYKTPEGTIYYKKMENEIAIVSYRGEDRELFLPSQLEGLPVTAIEKKAFMGSRRLQRILLPPTLFRLGEWAFAYCQWLESVVLCRRKMEIGKGIFLGDDRLDTIGLLSNEEWQEQWNKKECALPEELPATRIQEAVLLAAVNQMEDSGHLMDFAQAGKKHWIEQWDNRLRKILSEPDEKGYTEMILCGEEDLNCNIENFICEKRKRKSRFCFLRLLHPEDIDPDTKTILENYLISHCKQVEKTEETSEEAWLVLKEEKGHLRSYYELYTELGCLTQDNYEATIKDLGSSDPEMKAYFMRYQDEHWKQEDFFEQFSL